MHAFDINNVNNSGVSNLLSFEQHKVQLVPHHQGHLDDYSMWEQSLIISTDQPSSSPHLFHDFSSSASDSSQEGTFSWLYSDATLVGSDCIQDSTTLPQESSFPHERPHLGESSSTETSKKQCTTKTKLQQNKSSSSNNSTALPSKDPQSIAAKNRRERISERLKVLQELVPNGSKVDMVTMLEKAISYVKFLQLQVKVLATDEFWPVHGGKAPDISQVKEAIDAILSTQRDSRNSSSSSKS